MVIVLRENWNVGIIPTGRMECWNDGIMGKKILLQPNIPFFHYSILPDL